MKATHFFELPIYTKPHQEIVSFFKQMTSFEMSQVQVSYFRGKLEFSCFSGLTRYETAIFPMTPSFSKPRRLVMEDLIYRFASRLNCASCLISEDCSIMLELKEPAEDKKILYGNDVRFIIEVAVSCRDTAKEIALDSFFTVIETSTRKFV